MKLPHYLKKATTFVTSFGFPIRLIGILLAHFIFCSSFLKLFSNNSVKIGPGKTQFTLTPKSAYS